MTWNSCKKAPSRLLDLAKSAKKFCGDGAVVLLQEIPRWDGGAAYKGFVVHSRGPSEGRAGSDTGILLPRY